MFFYKEESLVGTVNVDGYYVDFDVNIQIQPGAPVQFSVHSGFSMKSQGMDRQVSSLEVLNMEKVIPSLFTPILSHTKGGIQFISPHEGIVSAELTALMVFFFDLLRKP